MLLIIKTIHVSSFDRENCERKEEKLWWNFSYTDAINLYPFYSWTFFFFRNKSLSELDAKNIKIEIFDKIELPLPLNILQSNISPGKIFLPFTSCFWIRYQLFNPSKLDEPFFSCGCSFHVNKYLMLNVPFFLLQLNIEIVFYLF